MSMLRDSVPSSAPQPTPSATDPSVLWRVTATGVGRQVVVTAPAPAAILSTLEGTVTDLAGGLRQLVGPLSARNAEAARGAVPCLAPTTVGLRTSAGFGDRLGLATPGHVAALRAAGGAIVPVFAQQSIREMTRTGRSARDVVDAATWGACEAAWDGGFGSDADHLKTTDDVDACLAAGFTGFTVDPGAHVDGTADAASVGDLRDAASRLPWPAMEDSLADTLGRFAGRTFDVEGEGITFSEEATLRAAVKYGRAVAHVAMMYRHLLAARPGRDFDFEVSVDETDTPTSAAEHIYVAMELRRLGVRWESLAPRFVGRFEKGVDYIGDLGVFEADFAIHAKIARQYGPYKISLHSGSDKFSIYPIVARHTRGLVHLKTAGTSYLEALRAVAKVSPDLFREICAFALSRYEEDRQSYHVSADLASATRATQAVVGDPSAALDHFDARQVLHVTFGSVLRHLGPDGQPLFATRILALLGAHGDVYADCLAQHFLRHLLPFSQSS